MVVVVWSATGMRMTYRENTTIIDTTNCFPWQGSNGPMMSMLTVARGCPLKYLHQVACSSWPYDNLSLIIVTVPSLAVGFGSLSLLIDFLELLLYM